MPATAVIICEETGRWGAALRRENVASLRETRSIEECWRELAQFPAAFVVLEIQAGNAERMFKRIVTLERDFPHAAAAAVLLEMLSSLEPWLREYGFAAVVTSLLEASDLASIVRRHLARFETGAAEATGRVMAELPWEP